MRIICGLIAALALGGCAAAEGVAREEPKADAACFATSLTKQLACVHKLEDIASLDQKDGYAVELSSAYLQRINGTYLMSRTERGDPPYIVLDPTQLRPGQPGFGLAALYRWPVIAIGYYTSSDVKAPVVEGATGTLHLRRIGYVSGKSRSGTTESPYRPIIRRELAARESGQPTVLVALASTPDALEGLKQSTAQCNGWSFDEAAATEFFARAEERAQPIPGEASVCFVDGLIEADGAKWDFVIYPDGSATWKHDHGMRYWHCGADCAELLPGF